MRLFLILIVPVLPRTFAQTENSPHVMTATAQSASITVPDYNEPQGTVQNSSQAPICGITHVGQCLSQTVTRSLLVHRKEGARGIRLDSRFAFRQGFRSLHNFSAGGYIDTGGDVSKNSSHEQMIQQTECDLKPLLGAAAVGIHYERRE